MNPITQIRTISQVGLALALIVYLAGCQLGPTVEGASHSAPIPTSTPWTTGISLSTSANAPSVAPTPTRTPVEPIPTMQPVTVVVPTSTLTPETREIGYPPDTRVGISHLDAIIDAVLANDLDRILNLIHFAQVGCTTQPGFGGPPKCRPGEDSGTLVEGVPTLGVSEGMGLRRDELGTPCPSKNCRLVAVLNNVTQSFRSEDWALPAKYALVFGVTTPPGCCIVLLADDKGIVHFMSARSLDDVGQLVSGDFVLPPVYP